VDESEQIKLSSTRLYDFCDPSDRGEWLDITIALIEYLRSGTSRVGFLNNAINKNMLRKDRAEEDSGEASINLTQATDADKGPEDPGKYA
jgi:hypothetical protein